MPVVLVIHIAAGGLGLVLGAVALSATKGAPVHRKAGMLFVYAMLTMCAGGVAIAAVRGVAPAINVPAALITAYLVLTSLATIKRPSASWHWLGLAAMVVAFTVGVISLTFGFEALVNGGTRKGMPAFPFFLFGTVGLMASVSDLRMLRRGGLQGAARLARHLWRMCFALFIAALSFFIGQADEFPEALRVPALLALPVVAVLVTMLYWLWRVRVRRSLRGLVGVTASVLALMVGPAAGHAQATARDSVIAVVHEFFRGMAARDTAALARIQVPGSMHYALGVSDTVIYRERSGQAWLRQLAESRDTLLERIWDPTVLVHGPLATLWAPYDIYRNGQFVHCGVDTFTLVRRQAGWQIASVAFTMEPTGCPPSPLGPLRR